jgi:hypothetical protein
LALASFQGINQEGAKDQKYVRRPIECFDPRREALAQHINLLNLFLMNLNLFKTSIIVIPETDL